MKYLYKYPQTAFPYADLVETNRGSARTEFEYELLDTEAFVECAKTSPEDVFVRITVHNRGPEPAAVHVLPTLWFHNEWFWHASTGQPSRAKLLQVQRVLSFRPFIPSSGSYTFTATENQLLCCSRRTIRTPSNSSARPTAPPTSSITSTTTSSTDRPRR